MQSLNTGKASPVKTMQLNDQKAGMQGLDKEAINRVIYEASKGTPYFAFQEKRQQRIDKQINQLSQEIKDINEHQKKDALKKMDILCAELEATRNLTRSIVHIDMDAFYAAVEMLDDPSLKTKPMAVGSSSMLATSNYEARKFGVRAAMPGFIAKKLCPDLVIVPPNFEKYRRLSKQVKNIVKEYDPNYAAMSLDEMYFDLTDYILRQYRKQTHNQNCQKELMQSSPIDHSDEESLMENDDIQIPNTAMFSEEENFSKCPYCYNIFISDMERDQYAYRITEEIRQRVCEATQLTVSAGIAPNTMLAKVCSDQNKPNGQYQIPSNIDDVKKFISSLPVRKVSGIGPVQSQLLNSVGIFTCGNLWDKRDIVSLLFSSMSSEFYLEVAMGLGSTVVKNDHVRKSIGVEVTFKEMHEPNELHQKCEELCEEVADDLKSRNLVGKVVVLKIKTVEFESHTRNSTLPIYTSDKEIITKAAKKLLDNEITACGPQSLKLRLMGIRMANLLKENEASDEKQTKLKDFLKPQTSTQNQTPSESESNQLKIENLELQRIFENNDKSPKGKKKDVNSCTPKIDEKYFSSTIDQCNNSLTKLTCPVCNMEQNCNELVEFNVHVDNCLSKKAIKEILSSEMAVLSPVTKGEKRKKCSSKATKQLKTESTAIRKISEYFQ